MNVSTSNGSSSIANQEKKGWGSSSKREQKRGYQWLMNASDKEIAALYKKQVLAHANATRGASFRIDSLRHENSGSQSRTPTGEHLIRPWPVQSLKSINDSNDNVPIILYYNPNKEKKRFNYQRGGSSRQTYPNIAYGYPIYPGFKNFIPIDHTSNANNGNFTRPVNYNNGTQNNFPSLGPSFNIGNRAIMPSGHTYGNGQANLLAWNPFYNSVNGTFVFMGPTHNSMESSITSATPIRAQQVSSSNLLSLNGSNNNSKQIATSFPNFQDNPTESDPPPSLRRNYGTFLNQPLVPDQEVLATNYDISEELSTNVVPTDGINKNKGSNTRKKELAKKFPANVKSLLATGVFDGVPIKYVSWSRENTLRGVIKGIAYLCSCKDCKFTKAVNAFEFENHAGCKTKHPNNHIYGQNGKSIYAVTQELKNTPEDKLFEVMEKVTGSPLNQKNFLKWKESYQTIKGESQCSNEQDGAIVISGTLD